MLTTLVLCLAGIAGLYVRLHGEFPRGVVFTAIVLIAGATSLPWYTLFEPSPLEVAAFAITAWLGVATLSTDEDGRKQQTVRLAAWIGLFVAPLAIIFWTLTSRAQFHLLQSRIADVLFSSWHGFLSWTPVAYIAVIGTILYGRRNPRWAIASLAMTAAAAWTVGASELWLREPAFGARPLLSVLAVLAPGLAYLVDVVRQRPVAAVVPIVALPLVWNYLLMVQYTVGMLPKDDPVSFARMVRQQADLQARSMPLYPFAFPANLWFAWREGVPVDRYDVLAIEPRVSSFDLELDRSADRFLLDGWEGPTAEGEDDGWWIGERHASLVVPLTLESGRPVRLTVVARSRYEEPVVEADLALLVNGHEIGSFSPAATRANDAQFTIPETALREGLNRISIVSRGTHRVDPSDTRPPGPLARRGTRSAWPVAVYRIAITPIQ